mgnify:CR=1 FL=1
MPVSAMNTVALMEANGFRREELRYVRLKEITIRASVSKGFRSPNIREMYMWGAANADLKPESMVNYEVAVGQSF